MLRIVRLRIGYVGDGVRWSNGVTAVSLKIGNICITKVHQWCTERVHSFAGTSAKIYIVLTITEVFIDDYACTFNCEG